MGQSGYGRVGFDYHAQGQYISIWGSDACTVSELDGSKAPDDI